MPADHALLNAHALLGFPRGMQGARVTVRLRHPRGWTVETPLPEGPEGYEAESYDHAVDSPLPPGARPDDGHPHRARGAGAHRGALARAEDHRRAAPRGDLLLDRRRELLRLQSFYVDEDTLREIVLEIMAKEE